MSPSLESAALACGTVVASRPAQCAALTALLVEQPAMALADVAGLAGVQRLHLGRRCEVRVHKRSTYQTCRLRLAGWPGRRPAPAPGPAL